MEEQKNSSIQNEASVQKEVVSEGNNLKNLNKLIVGEPVKDYLKNEKTVVHRDKETVNKLTAKENELHQKSKKLESDQDSRNEKFAEMKKLQEKVASAKKNIYTINDKIDKRKQKEQSFLYKLFKGPYNALINLLYPDDTLTKKLHSEMDHFYSTHHKIEALAGEILTADIELPYLEKEVIALQKEVEQMKKDPSEESRRIHNATTEAPNVIATVKSAREFATKHPQAIGNASPARSGR